MNLWGESLSVAYADGELSNAALIRSGRWRSRLPVAICGSGLLRSRAHLRKPAAKFLAEQIFQNKNGVRRTLGQPAHQVGIPLGPEWNINAAAPAIFNKFLLQVATHSI